QKFGSAIPRDGRQLVRCRQYQRRVAVLISSAMQRLRSLLGNQRRAPIQEADRSGNMENMLVQAAKEKNLVAFDRTAESEAELLLAVVRRAVEISVLRVKHAVAQEVEAGAMPVVRSGLGHHVHDCSPRPSQFRTIGVGRNAKLLHHFVRKLVGGAIAAASLPKKRVVVIPTVDEVAGLISADPAKRQVAIGGGRQSARILRDSRSQQSQVSEAPPIKRQVRDGALVNQGRNGAGLRVHQRRRPGNGYALLRPG